MVLTPYRQRIVTVGIVTCILIQRAAAQAGSASPINIGKSEVFLPLKAGNWTYKDQSGASSSKVATYASNLKSEIPGRFTILMSTTPVPQIVSTEKPESITVLMGSKVVSHVRCFISLTGSKSRKVFNCSWKVEGINFTATAFLKDEAKTTAKQKGVEFIKQVMKGLIVKPSTSRRK